MSKSIRVAEGIAGLSQAVAVLRVFQEAGFNVIQARESTGCGPDKLIEQTSFEWIELEVLRIQRQERHG